MPTWGQLLAEGRSLLDSPAFAPFEAEELLASAAGRPRGWFHARRREEAHDGDAARYRGLVARRAAGEPLQYLLGEWEFLGRTFRVDPRALIPRGETEAIVEIAREAAPAARAILDGGTGSGVLAVSLAIERPEARVVAVDRSEAALALARANAALHTVATRVSFLASDWLSALAPRPLFDLAVANPPYVPRVDAPHVEKTVSDHEPHLALFGGDDGLDAVRVLLAELPPRLLPGAPFLFEIGYGQAREVCGLVEASPAFMLEDVRLDPAGIPRTVVARRC
ncbi:MAG TPA: peptide chain release factor N(5)-glutamine methyltransferase [Thermoanaerobaculia bacterium]|nr:peptide chain release factor N(5)-glutamine methyltransferase [Thermoanaerobaculia bacterium]